MIIRRQYNYDEVAKAMQSANSALYLVLLPVDSRLGGKNSAELKRRFNRWISPS